MAFYNNYPNRKDWRKRPAKKTKGLCRCDYCIRGKLHKHAKRDKGDI